MFLNMLNWFFSNSKELFEDWNFGVQKNSLFNKCYFQWLKQTS